MKKLIFPIVCCFISVAVSAQLVKHVVIDKEGKLAARNVRGEQVREAILKIRQ